MLIYQIHKGTWYRILNSQTTEESERGFTVVELQSECSNHVVSSEQQLGAAVEVRSSWWKQNSAQPLLDLSVLTPPWSTPAVCSHLLYDQSAVKLSKARLQLNAARPERPYASTIYFLCPFTGAPSRAKAYLSSKVRKFLQYLSSTTKSQQAQRDFFFLANSMN